MRKPTEPRKWKSNERSWRPNLGASSSRRLWPWADAAQGGRRQSLTKESLEKLFETAGSLASEAVASQKLEFERRLEVFRCLKRKTREEVLRGETPPTLTIPLMESEIFSEDLFPKDVFLKVYEAASGSHSENVFPALKN